MSEKHPYRTWIFLDGSSLRIKESFEHPGHGWADLNALLERIAELEAENEGLREELKAAIRAQHNYNDNRKWFIEELRKRDEQLDRMTT